MANKKYSAEIALRDRFTSIMGKAIRQTKEMERSIKKTQKAIDKLKSKDIEVNFKTNNRQLETVKRNINSIEDKTIDVGAKLNSSFHSTVNTINRAIIPNKTINITAKQDITRTITNIKRDLFTMGRNISVGVKGSISGLSGSIGNTFTNVFGKLGGIAGGGFGKVFGTVARTGIASTMGSIISGGIAGSVGGGLLSGSLGGALSGGLLGGTVGGLIGKGGFFGGILGGAKNKFNKFRKNFKNPFKGLKGKFKNPFKGMFNKFSLGDSFKNWNNEFDSIKDTADLTKTLAPFEPKITPKIDTAELKGLEKVKAKITNAFRGANDTISNTMGRMGRTARIYGGLLAPNLMEIFDNVSDSIKTGVNKAKANLIAGGKALKSALKNITNGKFSAAGKALKSSLMSVGKAIKNTAKTAAKGIKLKITNSKAIKTLTNTLSKLKSTAKKARRIGIFIAVGGTRMLNTIIGKVKGLARKVWQFTLRAKTRLANSALGRVLGKVKAVSGKVFKFIVKAINKASRVLGKVWGGIRKISGKTFSAFIKAKDGASRVIGKIRSSLFNLKSLAASIVIGAAAGLGLKSTIGGAAALEQNMVSIKHFISRNNGGTYDAKTNTYDAVTEKASAGYVDYLTKTANKTPFTNAEVMSAGRRGINVAQGDIGSAQGLVQMAADMAALNPQKTIMDAMEALADLKMGETARLKEFGFKMSMDDIDAMGGPEKAFEKLTSKDGALGKLFSGGAAKLSETAMGKWSTIKGQFQTLFTQIGGPALDPLKRGMDRIIKLFNNPKVMAAVNQFSKMFGDAFVKIVDAGISLGKKLSPIIEGVAGALGFSIPGIEDNSKASAVKDKVQTVKTKFKMVMQSDGFQSLLGGIKAFIEDAKGLFDDLMAKVNENMPLIKETVGNVMKLVGAAFRNVAPVIKTVVGVIGEALKALMPSFNKLLTWVTDNMPFIKQVIVDAGTIIKKAIRAIKPVIRVAIEAGLAILDAFKEIWPSVSTIVKDALDLITPLIEKLEPVAMSVIKRFRENWPEIADKIDSTWKIIKPIIGFMVDALGGIVDVAMDIISKVKSAIDWLGKLFNKKKQDPGPVDYPAGSNRSSKASSSSSKTSTYGRRAYYNGSHALGLDRVPFDGYIAKLHRGESVLTKTEAIDYRKLSKLGTPRELIQKLNGRKDLVSKKFNNSKHIIPKKTESRSNNYEDRSDKYIRMQQSSFTPYRKDKPNNDTNNKPQNNITMNFYGVTDKEEFADELMDVVNRKIDDVSINMGVVENG